MLIVCHFLCLPSKNRKYSNQKFFLMVNFRSPKNCCISFLIIHFYFLVFSTFSFNSFFFITSGGSFSVAIISHHLEVCPLPVRFSIYFINPTLLYSLSDIFFGCSSFFAVYNFRRIVKYAF